MMTNASADSDDAFLLFPLRVVELASDCFTKRWKTVINDFYSPA